MGAVTGLRRWHTRDGSILCGGGIKGRFLNELTAWRIVARYLIERGPTRPKLVLNAASLMAVKRPSPLISN